MTTMSLPPWQGAPHRRRGHAVATPFVVEPSQTSSSATPASRRARSCSTSAPAAAVSRRSLLDAGAPRARVELDPVALRRLRRRVSATNRAWRSSQADASAVPLPREPFAVVANLPFAAGTAILRRLLGDPRRPADPARRDRGVGPRREADGGVAFDAARLHVGSVVRARASSGACRACVSLRPRASMPPSCARRGATNLSCRRREAREYVALLRRSFDVAGVARPAPPARHRPPACAGARIRSRMRAARDLDPRQWALLYAAVRPATRRPPAAAPRRRRGSRR